jgi:glycosyltransferase involved in cell wall biosynthesis
MTKIAFIIHGLCMGGAEKFAIALLNHLHKNGNSVLVLLLSDEKTLANELHPDIPIFTATRKSKYDLSICNKINYILIHNSVNKVFCINSYSYFLTKIALFKNSLIEVFLSLHSTIAPSFKNYFQNMLYFRFVNADDTIIFLCNNQKDQLINNYFINNGSHYVINNGIDTDYFRPIENAILFKQSARAQFKLNDDESVILNVARLSPEKGHLDAVEALYLLHDKFREQAHLVLVGDGPALYKHKIRKYIAERGLEDYVHFEGVQQDVRRYYQFADIFTLTSYNTETFSIAALEAMSYGLPCSMTEIGGASEMILPGINGLLTTPHDPLSIADSWYTLLSRKPKKELIRAHVVDHFNKDSMLAQYDAILL